MKPIGFLFIMFVAYVLKRIGLAKKEQAMFLLKILTHVTLPAVAITAFSSLECNLSLLWLTLIGFIATFGPYMCMMFISKNRSRVDRVTDLFSVSGYNVGCYGIPLIQGIYGISSAAYCVMFDVGNAIMVLSGNTSITTTLLPMDGEETHISAGTIIKKFFKSFSLDVYLVLLVLYIFNIHIPEAIPTFLSPIANANAFLAMFMLGLLFTPPKNKGQWGRAFRIVIFRNVVSVIIALICFYLLPLPLEVRRILILLLMCPIGAMSPGFIEQCHGDSELAAFINSVSTIISLIIMSVLVGYFSGI